MDPDSPLTELYNLAYDARRRWQALQAQADAAHAEMMRFYRVADTHKNLLIQTSEQ